MRWLIYGAYGYTGELVTRRAVEQGHRPLLAGRNPAALGALAEDVRLRPRSVALTDATGLRRLLEEVDAVAHCAGPFSATARPMVEACLDTGTDYLDVNGEVGVFEWIYEQHDRAAAAGVVLLPGVGFDVVPTDCLAARLAAAVSGASSLELAFQIGGGMSVGTRRTAVAGIASGGLRRIGGALVPCQPWEPSREVAFASGPATVRGIPWGDLASAYRSTGISTITTYTRMPAGSALIRAVRRPVRHLFRIPLVRRAVTAAVSRGGAGPDPATRARTGSEVWGEVRDLAGHTVTATLAGPNPYDLTADAVVRAIDRVGAVPPGAHTPATAFGAEFVALLDGVRVNETRVSG